MAKVMEGRKVVMVEMSAELVARADAAAGLQDHPSNALATGYAEIAQNSFTDAVMLGAREASVLM